MLHVKAAKEVALLLVNIKSLHKDMLFASYLSFLFHLLNICQFSCSSPPVTLAHTRSIDVSLLYPQPTPNMSATGQQPNQQQEHRSNGSSSTSTIVLGLLSPPPTPPPSNSGLPPPPSQPPDTTPDNGTGNCIEVLVESKEAETEVVEEQQDDDTTKTISPPPEATADFKSTVKAIFLRLIALPGDLRAVDQNQASTACQPSS